MFELLVRRLVADPAVLGGPARERCDRPRAPSSRQSRHS